MINKTIIHIMLAVAITIILIIIGNLIANGAGFIIALFLITIIAILKIIFYDKK